MLATLYMTPKQLSWHAYWNGTWQICSFDLIEAYHARRSDLKTTRSCVSKRLNEVLFYIFETQVRCVCQLVWYLVILRSRRTESKCTSPSLPPHLVRWCSKIFMKPCAPGEIFNEIKLLLKVSPFLAWSCVKSGNPLVAPRQFSRRQPRRHGHVVSAAPVPCEASPSAAISPCHFFLTAGFRVNHWPCHLIPFDCHVYQSHGY